MRQATIWQGQAKLARTMAEVNGVGTHTIVAKLTATSNPTPHTFFENQWWPESRDILLSAYTKEDKEC